MAATVAEIMNRELFHLRAEDSAGDALGYILALGVSGAPVLDRHGRPVGIVSMRDLVDAGRATVADRMTRQVVTVPTSAPIETAARLLADTGLHRVIAVDESHGRAAGMVSALDVIRGLLGLPARHPGTFPHFDKQTHLTWMDDAILDEENVDLAPDEAGVLVLLHGGPGEPERVVWAEATNQVRLRLIDLLSLPQTQTPGLKGWLDRGGIRFRAAACADGEVRKRIAAEILERSRHDWTRHWQK